MTDLSKSIFIVWIQNFIVGCAFACLHAWATVDFGWTLQNSFWMIGLFGLGITVPVKPLTIRSSCLYISIVLAHSFALQHLLLAFWLGYSTSKLVTLSEQNRIQPLLCWLVLIFGITTGTAFISTFLNTLSLEWLWLIPTILLFQHKDAFTGFKLHTKLDEVLQGMLVGTVFTALWNHQFAVTQPTSTHLLYAGTALIIGWVIHLSLFKDSTIWHHRLGWLAVLIWPFMGYASIQSWSGEHILRGSIVLSLVLGLTISRIGWFGTMTGLLIHPLYSSSSPELWGIIVICALWLLFSTRRLASPFLAFSLALFCLLTDRGPIVNTLPVSKFAHWPKEQHLQSSYVWWDKNGWFFVGNKNQMSKDVTIATKNIVITENTRLNLNTSEYNNTRFYAKMLANLTKGMEQILILHDATGLVNSELEESQGQQILAQVSQPSLTRILAETIPTAKNDWLNPNRQLLTGSSGSILTSNTKLDLVIDIVDHPWPSSLSDGLHPRHIVNIQKSLSEEGIAAFIIHLKLIPKNGLATLAHRIEAVFPNTLYMMPENNIDSILVLASNTSFTYRFFKDRLQRNNPSLLGHIIFRKYPLFSSEEINFTPQYQPPIPFAHLTQLSNYVDTAQKIWPTIPIDEVSTLNAELETRKEYLFLLSEGIAGNLEALRQNTLPEALADSLVAPHIRSAKKEILKAQIDGQSSPYWSEAKRYALTAQMIDPNALEAWLLLGEIALGEGFLELAVEKFSKAQELSPTSIEALNGLARVAGLQNRLEDMERLLLEAQQLEMGNWITHYNLATFYQQQGASDKSISLLQDALELPNGDNKKTRIGIVEYYIEQEEWTRGLLEIDRLIQQRSTPSATMWFLRGRIHFGLELWEKAEIDFRKATLEDPQMHAALGSIGLIKIALGDLEGAAQAFRSTLRFDPNNDVARRNLQQVLEQLNSTLPSTPQQRSQQ